MPGLGKRSQGKRTEDTFWLISDNCLVGWNCSPCLIELQKRLRPLRFLVDTSLDTSAWIPELD
jgi:hypothetical protein